MWEYFGLEKNPFDIKAVEKYGIVPTSTFIGRDEHREGLKKIIQTRDHSLSLVVGEKGIGKTSLGNVVRADICKNFFITVSEIDSQSDWSSQDFILHALGNIYETATSISRYKSLPPKYVEACSRIVDQLSSLFESGSSNLGLQLAGFGLEKGGGKGLSATSISFLRLQMKKIVHIIRESGYKGLVLQFNNLDNIEDEKRLSQVLSDLRDFLVSDNIHFIFLGNKIMESCFKINSKVNECITYDVQLGPLNYPEIIQILDKRYNTFKIPNMSPLKPISDDALKTIYDLYEGNIRQIFFSLDHAVIHAQDELGELRQLSDADIQKVLVNRAKRRIGGGIQPRAFDVLEHILAKQTEVTNTEITKKFRLKPQNTSKYLTQLRSNNLIVALGREGRNIYYKAVNEARWLLLSPEEHRQLTLNDELH